MVSTYKKVNIFVYFYCQYEVCTKTAEINEFINIIYSCIEIANVASYLREKKWIFYLRDRISNLKFKNMCLRININ